MDKLWAPWRSKYIYLRKQKRCIFCGKENPAAKAEYLIHRSAHSFSMLNIYPYNNGHVMVAPYRHVRSLELLSDAELTDLMKLVNNTKTNLDKKLKPHGYNIGFNVGKAGGAGFAGHMHIHVVPRWIGDSNFMPVIGVTKVLPDSLDATYRLFRRK